MKELSLNILDISENSIAANADTVFITIYEDLSTLKLTISDNGKGMTEEFLEDVENPFKTSRKTRNVGLGIPLLKLQAQQTGGDIKVSSRYIEKFPENHGTEISALFYNEHIDMTPLGDINSTIFTLIQCNPHIDFVYKHINEGKTVSLDTRQMREILGDVELNNPEVMIFIKEYLREQYEQ